jgi:23S rRNA pseudouridine2605 synthase
VWLTFAIREGKNREVRKVLEHLGLTVTRLIRISFGPFKLGELPEAAVEEVRTRVLREQLGERLAALAGADFSTPLKPKPPREATTQKAPAPVHSWRAQEEERSPKKLRRKFRGARSDDTSGRETPAGKGRESTLTDRNGRHVPVERFGEAPRPEPAKPERRFRQGPRQGPRQEHRKTEARSGQKRSGNFNPRSRPGSRRPRDK